MNLRLKLKERVAGGYWSLVAMSASLILSLQPVFAADTIWTRFSTIMKDVYGQLVGISTIVGVTAAAVALQVRIVSVLSEFCLRIIKVWRAEK